MYLLYDLILSLSALVLIPYYLLRALRHGKARRGIRERLGFYAPTRLAPLRGRQVLWIHAVSVGETRAAIPLIKALKRSYPDHALVLSNVTETGHAIAREIADLDLCLFFPFDLSWVVRRVLRQVRPAAILIVETEIWPNFVRLGHAAGIPVVLVNGRISDRSFPRYRLLKGVLQPILEKFSFFCMQTRADADRIIQMGAPEERVTVTRNLKFDMQAATPDESSVEALKADLCLPPEIPIWVAGSTHAGEEEVVIETFRRLGEEGREMLLILVPRHPERCAAVGEILQARGIRHVLRSHVAEADNLKPGEVLLVDTLGEMLKFYAVSDVVFVGGSLVDIGGHNILEASLVKKAPIFGPRMHNFKEISRLVREGEGGFQVEDGDQLLSLVRRLLDDPEALRAAGENGYALLQKNAGATDETLQTIDAVLGRRHGNPA